MRRARSTPKGKRLSTPALEKVVAYERAHDHRTPVLAVLEQRLEELHTGAEPSGGDPGAPTPAEVFPPRGGGASKASPQTAAEPDKPAPHGVSGHRSEPRG